MRLLRLSEDGVFSHEEFIGEEIPTFAILSHTWGPDKDEVTLKDLVEDIARAKTGYQKLQFCAKQAASDSLQWFWIDTCCIDKTSSAELSEAINCMYQWYKTSARCYVYLSDVSIDESQCTEPALARRETWVAHFRRSRWFTRGWTLQELLAPKHVDFFSKEGIHLGDKSTLRSEIHEITGIVQRALNGTLLYEFPVEERMSWADGRKTRREEDMAYSLLGIFDVNMPLMYGEGRKKALTRLYREIRDTLPNDPPVPLMKGLQYLGLENQQTSTHNAGDEVSPPITYIPCTSFDNPPIAVAFPSQKEMDITVLGDDSTLRHLRLENGIPITAKWQSDGKWFADGAIMFSRSRSRIEIIAPTPYGQVLYQETKTGLLLKEYWDSLGHTITRPLTAASWAPNRLDIFGIGKGGNVLRKTLASGTWLPSKGGWEDLGGSFFLPPQVLSTVPGRLDLLCVSDHGSSLYHKWWDGSSWKPSQTDWECRGGQWMSPPTAVATDRNRMDLFMCAHGKIHHATVKDNNWTFYWWPIDEPGENTFISRPAAVYKPGRLDIFCLRSDDQIYHKTLLTFENRWDPIDRWNALGGEFASAPTAVINRSGKTYVFCKGHDEEIYYMELEEKKWTSIGGPD